MIQSMTGFGKATAEISNRKVSIEVKSLNSKQMDLSMRMPHIYKEHEMAVRNLLTRQLERGKVDFLIFVENVEKETSSKINQEVLAAYHAQICASAKALGVATPTNWLEVLLRMPDVLKQEFAEADVSEWHEVEKAVKEALAQMIAFRTQEGAMLENLFKEKIAAISSLLANIEAYEPERVEKVKNRISEALQKLQNNDYDKNRFEQEMIYHIEKLDINEEKARLTNHLSYFLETMQTGTGQGKKLGFIIQEIGREINTMGSKSNHAQMQQLVVQMKDELEQMKEQILNVM